MKIELTKSVENFSNMHFNLNFQRGKPIGGFRIFSVDVNVSLFFSALKNHFFSYLSILNSLSHCNKLNAIKYKTQIYKLNTHTEREKKGSFILRVELTEFWILSFHFLHLFLCATSTEHLRSCKKRSHSKNGSKNYQEKWKSLRWLERNDILYSIKRCELMTAKYATAMVNPQCTT